MSQNVLTIRGLRKQYRRLVAVDDVDIEISPGEFVGFIGPNGAGKSTTMNCVAGTIAPDSGTIEVQDVDAVTDPVGARAHLGFVPQHLHLYGYLTGEEYLRFVGDVRGIAEADQAREIEDLMTITELFEARHRVVKEYSGGMQRKLAICGALLGAPPLLLLDESFVGLDPESTHAIRERLAAHCEAGGAILLSSHVLDMLERICSRIVMLVDGKVALDRSMTAIQKSIDSGEFRDLTELYLTTAGKKVE
jgi:ABC-2 type transport system ATP-binding protein